LERLALKERVHADVPVRDDADDARDTVTAADR
jgi:hypothetical protein